MTREAIEYFKFHRKIFCEDYLKMCPKDSIAYQATLKEKEFYDMAIKALEQEPRKGHWIIHGEPPINVIECSECGQKYHNHYCQPLAHFCSMCGCRMVEPQESEVEE